VRKNIEEMGKYVTELIIEAENDDKVLDTVNKPYTILHDSNLDRLNQAINILAVKDKDLEEEELFRD
jgi:hypothetical protein